MNIRRTLSTVATVATVATEVTLGGAIGLAHAQTTAPANSATPTTPSADAARTLMPGSPSATPSVAPSMQSMNTDISTSNIRMNNRMTNRNVPASGTMIVSNSTAGLASGMADAAPAAAPPDHPGRPFAGLDKRCAALYVVDGSARLTGASIRSFESAGDNVVWLNYAAAVELCSVEIIDPLQRRPERIATSKTSEKRLSNGCSNVPVAFFDAVATPALGHARGMLYGSPALTPSRQVFLAGAA